MLWSRIGFSISLYLGYRRIQEFGLKRNKMRPLKSLFRCVPEFLLSNLAYDWHYRNPTVSFGQERKNFGMKTGVILSTGPGIPYQITKFSVSSDTFLFIFHNHFLSCWESTDSKTRFPMHLYTGYEMRIYHMFVRHFLLCFRSECFMTVKTTHIIAEIKIHSVSVCIWFLF